MLIAFPTDLVECGRKLKAWSKQDGKLHLLNCTNSICDTGNPVRWYQSMISLERWNAICYVIPWQFSNLGNLTGAARGRMRGGKSWMRFWDSCLEMAPKFPVTVGCSSIVRSWFVFCGRVIPLEHSSASRVGRFWMQWQVRQLEFQNQESAGFVLFLMAGLVVLRCFWFPSTEAEPRKGRELLAKRGEQKIKKNQVQAIRHSFVATSRIVGHRPRLPRNQSELSHTNSYMQGACGRTCFPASLFFPRGGDEKWTSLVVCFYLILFGSEFQSLEGLVWEAFGGMFECSHVVPGWNDEGKEAANGREEGIWRIEGPKMCPTYTLSDQQAHMLLGNIQYCFYIDIAHHSATCSTNCYD